MDMTFSMIKPDATKANLIGEVVSYFERGGLRVVAAKMKKLTRKEAQAFYAEHKGKYFFKRLIEFTLSGPVLLMVLSGKNAVKKTRKIMGKTKFEDAARDTIRRRFASGIPANAVHGSDCDESAKREISFFFNKSEIYVE